MKRRRERERKRRNRKGVGIPKNRKHPKGSSCESCGGVSGGKGRGRKGPVHQI